MPIGTKATVDIAIAGQTRLHDIFSPTAQRTSAITRAASATQVIAQAVAAPSIPHFGTIHQFIRMLPVSAITRLNICSPLRPLISRMVWLLPADITISIAIARMLSAAAPSGKPRPNTDRIAGL